MPLRFIAHTAIEFGPLLLFFFVSGVWGFYPGAAALVISTLVALCSSVMLLKRFAYFSFTVSTFTLLSGIATLYLREPIWLVLEFTLSNLLFGLIILTARRRGKLLLRSLFSHMFLITDRGWWIISFRWGWVFITVGVTNQLFWYWYPDEVQWTMFRFIATILTIVFGLSQFFLSRRERLPEASPWGLRR